MPSRRCVPAILALTTLAVGALLVGSGGSPSGGFPDPRIAREHLQARSPRTAPPFRSHRSSQRVEPDWEAFDDVEVLLAEQGPGPGWPDPELRAYHQALIEHELLGNDVRRFYPRFACEMRCPTDGDGMNAGSHALCVQQCALDALLAPGGEHLAGWVMGLAAANEDAALYRDLSAAFPAAWEEIQTGLATSGPRASLSVLWGRAMRATAPGIQSSLYSFGKQQQGLVGRVATAASGRTACVWIGGQAVCP